ncbi:MAG: DNA polymerase III subunit delta' [Rhodospirillales bacterium]|nr:DNA polymerase III subunit delta' [Rhodospirillales bacterium]
MIETERSAPPTLAPRANPLLFGHDDAEREMATALAAGRLAHAWLLTGPSGIGKATLAFRFARYLLVEGSGGGAAGGVPAGLAVDAAHPVFRRIASGGHADLLTVERKLDDRRQRLRSDIVVDDVRGVGPFLASTPAEGGWRVVVVDGADAMTTSAANALLKVLEEPPDRSVLILTCARPARLLPTLRSRCRRVSLSPLSPAVVAELLGRYRPALPAAEIDGLARDAGGSIGAALLLADAGGLAIKAEARRLLATLPALDVAGLLKLADRVAAAEDDVAFKLSAESLLEWLEAVIRTAAGAPAKGYSGSDAPDRQALTAIAARASLDRWLEVWDNTARLLSQADHANLDRRQVLLASVFGVREVLGG